MDVARRQEPEPVGDDIEFSEDIITSLVRTLAVGLSPEARVALLGGEALAWRWGQHLAQACAEERNIRLVEADEFGVELRLLKSPAEIVVRPVQFGSVLACGGVAQENRRTRTIVCLGSLVLFVLTTFPAALIPTELAEPGAAPTAASSSGRFNSDQCWRAVASHRRTGEHEPSYVLVLSFSLS